MVKIKQSTSYIAPEEKWGRAITHIDIDEDGKMWAHNNEYATQINYNPFTGEPAPQQLPYPTEVSYRNTEGNFEKHFKYEQDKSK